MFNSLVKVAKALIILSVLFLSLKSSPSEVRVSKDWNTYSYGQLAGTLVIKNLNKLKKEIQGFNAQSLPHDAKKIRKSIGKVRGLFDIFIYAYPKYGKKDVLLKLRKVLDKGYDYYGNYKDLFDRLEISIDQIKADDYNKSDVVRLRKIVLKWNKKFFKVLFMEKHLNFLSTPLLSSLEARKLPKLPKYYWRTIDFSPSLAMAGYKNLRLMAYQLLEGSIEIYPEVIGITDIHNHDQQEYIFHEFRKKVRAILKLENYFPKFLTSEEKKDPAYVGLVSMVDRFGDLNDRFGVEYVLKSDILKLKGEIKKAQKKDLHERIDSLKTQLNDKENLLDAEKERITNSWNELQNWLINENIGQTLEDSKRVFQIR